MNQRSDLAQERRKILLIEDEPAVRRSLQLLLQGHGYSVRGYASAAALLADPSAPDAQALIADYRLRNDDGVSLLEQLKTLGFQGKAILITAFGSPALTAAAEAAGFARVLDKPFAERLLCDTVAHLL